MNSLHSFGGYLDGAQPEAGLAQGADGAFYGTTYYGGTNGFGTVFRLAFPPPPVLLSLFQTNGTSVLTWSTVTGQWYKLQFRTNLFQTNWFNLGNTNLATNATMTETDPTGTHKLRFYRAVLLP